MFIARLRVNDIHNSDQHDLVIFRSYELELRNRSKQMNNHLKYLFNGHYYLINSMIRSFVSHHHQNSSYIHTSSLLLYIIGNSDKYSTRPYNQDVRGYSYCSHPINPSMVTWLQIIHSISSQNTTNIQSDTKSRILQLWMRSKRRGEYLPSHLKYIRSIFIICILYVVIILLILDMNQFMWMITLIVRCICMSILDIIRDIIMIYVRVSCNLIVCWVRIRFLVQIMMRMMMMWYESDWSISIHSIRVTGLNIIRSMHSIR